MIVQRITFIPKRGQQNKVVELIKSGESYTPFQVPYRILLPSVGPLDVVAFELEFKDIAEFDRFWAGWNEKAPESFWEKWYGATENGGTSELWRVTE
jgi:hypothetical protein